MEEFEDDKTEPALDVCIFPDEIIDLEERARKIDPTTPEFKATMLRVGLAKSLFKHPREDGLNAYKDIISRIRESLISLNL